MFGIFKELRLIGQLASGFGRIVNSDCSKDYFSSLPNSTKNIMMDNALKMVGKFYNYQFKTESDVADVFPDFVVCAYILLAKETFPKDTIGHLDILNGMMKTIKRDKENIENEVLQMSSEYMKEHKIK